MQVRGEVKATRGAWKLIWQTRSKISTSSLERAASLALPRIRTLAGHGALTRAVRRNAARVSGERLQRRSSLRFPARTTGATPETIGV